MIKLKNEPGCMRGYEMARHMVKKQEDTGERGLWEMGRDEYSYLQDYVCGPEPFPVYEIGDRKEWLGFSLLIVEEGFEFTEER